MSRRTTAAVVLCLVLLGAALTPASDMAFTHVQLGEPVPEMSLLRLGGDMESYLGPQDSRASVFAFIKADSAHSSRLAGNWAKMQTAFVDESVHWTIIISDRHGLDNAEALWDSLAPGATVLIDSGDNLYGELGVALTPVVGIVDASGILRSYLPFRQINYTTVITANLRHILGLITAQQLEAILNPHTRATDSAQAAAKRKLKFSKLLLRRGRQDAALIQVNKVLADNPEMAEAYVLLADIHLAAGETEKAEEAKAKAEALSGAISEAHADSTATVVIDSPAAIQPDSTATAVTDSLPVTQADSTATTVTDSLPIAEADSTTTAVADSLPVSQDK